MNIIQDFKKYYKVEKLKTFITPGFKAIFVYRLGNFANKQFFLIKYFLYIFYFPLDYLIRILWGISISRKAVIGPGLFINHFSGIFIHDKVKLGKDCTVSQGVTVGVKYGMNDKGPKIGDEVKISAGAKVIGDINIGSKVIIGANAVVTKDLPSNCVAVGVPAKVVKEINSEDWKKYNQ